MAYFQTRHIKTISQICLFSRSQCSTDSVQTKTSGIVLSFSLAEINSESLCLLCLPFWDVNYCSGRVKLTWWRWWRMISYVHNRQKWLVTMAVVIMIWLCYHAQWRVLAIPSPFLTTCPNPHPRYTPSSCGKHLCRTRSLAGCYGSWESIWKEFMMNLYSSLLEMNVSLWLSGAQNERSLPSEQRQ